MSMSSSDSKHEDEDDCQLEREQDKHDEGDEDEEDPDAFELLIRALQPDVDQQLCSVAEKCWTKLFASTRKDVSGVTYEEYVA